MSIKNYSQLNKMYVLFNWEDELMFILRDFHILFVKLWHPPCSMLLNNIDFKSLFNYGEFFINRNHY